MRLRFAALIAGLTGAAIVAVAPALAANDGPVSVVSATFGEAKSARPVDFTARLAGVCGANASFCQAFCTRAAVGWKTWAGNLFAYHPVCRVTYRCGAQTTRAVEAAENETFDLSCRPGS